MIRSLIDKLNTSHWLSHDEWGSLLVDMEPADEAYLFSISAEITRNRFGGKVFVRGLLEIGNYCCNSCRYCGIQAPNRQLERYRLEPEEIVESCKKAYQIGFRSFVLQGGEEKIGLTSRMAAILAQLKRDCPEAALTLSIGEHSPELYEEWYRAGADRYLLRHETASAHLYEKFHPGMSLSHRMDCLYKLKEIGYQTGSGFLTGLPGQEPVSHADDFLFLQQLRPHMVGIGPFIPHRQTPLSGESSGSAAFTLRLLALTRLLLPDALLPATTALNTVHSEGRLMALRVASNVVMPNITPPVYRSLYSLYDGKKITGDEAAETLREMCSYLEGNGFSPALERGDFIPDRTKV